MPDSPTEPPNAPLNPSATALRPGDHVDPYTINRQIGSGGNSVVYKATDELLGKQVAIKQFLFTGVEDEAQLRAKIMTEAKLHQQAAKADPDRLVQVVDVVDAPQGLLLINEYISGPSLEQILAQNTDPMSLKQALGIVAATSQALDSIHRQGIVHLDLKPANILMPRSGGLKISDFGLASNVAEQAPPTAGTVRYMAPELLKNEKVDGRADLYALGMMAYEMIAGRAKFDQAFKLILRDQRNQAVRWVKWHTNPRTKAPPLIELLPDIPQQISDLIARLMDKDPAQRVGAAKDLLKAIKRHFAGKDIGPADDDTGPIEELTHEASTPGDTTVLPTRSNKLKYGIIAAVVLVLLAAGTGVLMLGLQAARHEAVQAAAVQKLDQAKQAYGDERYETALSLYNEVAQNEKYSDGFRQHAKAGVLFSQGRIDAQALHYDDAIRSFNRASELGDEYSDKADKLADEVRQAQAFALTIEQIEEQITNREFGEARKELDEWRDLAATEQEQMTLRALGARLEDQLSQWRMQELIKEANELTRIGKRAEAIELLKTGPQKMQITDLLSRLETQAAADSAATLAEAALDRGDPEEAIRQFEVALEAMPDDAVLKNRLNEVRTNWLVEEGLRMLAQGNVVGADQRLTEALGYQPDNQRARSGLAQIASSSRREAFIEAGDTAAANGDYATALKQYENALQLGVDDPLGDKMTSMRVQVLLKQSRVSLENGQIDQANDLVTQAHQLAPNDTDVAAVRREVQVRGEYIRHLNAGDDARGRSAFGEAKRHYLRAKAAMETPQVRARLDETEFDHLLAQARNYIAAKEFASARAQLQIAADINLTDEVRELLDQVRALDPGASP